MRGDGAPGGGAPGAGARGGRDRERPSQGDGAERAIQPELPEDVVAEHLDRAARARLRTLSRENADRVARHLVAAGRLIDTDPERAYEHAQAAVRRAGRVDVVREAAGLTAYATGRYAEALRELRTVRRLSGLDVHRAVEADCERGLGRPERALALARGPEVRTLPPEVQVELALVVSGARLDLDEPEAALLALEAPVVAAALDPEVRSRIAEARATVLESLGRSEEAQAERRQGGDAPEPEVVVFDLEETTMEPGTSPGDASTGGEDRRRGTRAAAGGDAG